MSVADLSEIRPFARAGYELMPLLARRTPRDKGWRVARYSNFDPRPWMAQGGAIGLRLRAQDIVVDVDPRNGGAESFERLCDAVGQRLDVGAPHVRTGGGGSHFFYRKPPELYVRGSLPQFEGIDFKHSGGYVVSAGSVHNRTGKVYRFDPASPSPNQAPMAPDALLALIERPAPRDRSGDGGQVTNVQLATLLAVVDASRYREYGAWLAFSAAVHDATDGHGMDVWAKWCRSDPEHGDEDHELLAAKWDSFSAGRGGGATYRTLFKAVSDAGRADLLRQLGAAFDFNTQPDDLDFGAPEPLDMEAYP